MAEFLPLPDNDPMASQEAMDQLFQATRHMMLRRQAKAQEVLNPHSSQPEVVTYYSDAMHPADVYQYAPEAGAALARLGVGAYFNEVCIVMTLPELIQIDLDLAYLGGGGYPADTYFSYSVEHSDMAFKSWFTPTQEEEKLAGYEYDDHEVLLSRAGKYYMATHERTREDEARESYVSIEYPLTQTRCRLLTTFVKNMGEHLEVPTRESTW